MDLRFFFFKWLTFIRWPQLRHIAQRLEVLPSVVIDFLCSIRLTISLRNLNVITAVPSVLVALRYQAIFIAESEAALVV